MTTSGRVGPQKAKLQDKLKKKLFFSQELKRQIWNGFSSIVDLSVNISNTQDILLRLQNTPIHLPKYELSIDTLMGTTNTDFDIALFISSPVSLLPGHLG